LPGLKGAVKVLRIMYLVLLAKQLDDGKIGECALLSDLLGVYNFTE
jgi:hypothetical protein